jgi:5'-nucleotidase
MNSFLATGGDGFTVFNEGNGQLGGEVDLDAAVSHFMAASPVAPGATDRLTRVN